MRHTPFHLGWFTSFAAPAWHAATDRDHGGDWWDGKYFAGLAQRLEASCFDLLFFEDTSTVSRAVGGSAASDLKNSLYAPKHDPVALLSYLAAMTETIGLVATASTSFYPPWLLARLLSTIDSLSGGRVGWNVVTSSEDDAARNFGMDKLPDPLTRYEMADEYLDLVSALWSSWEPDALQRNTETGVYVDPAKVHTTNFEGRFHRSLGPLNVLPSPQGKPVIAQAGASQRGRQFAAKHAELVFSTTAGGIDTMRAVRTDVRQRAAALDRNPDDVKVIFAAPVRFLEPGASTTLTEGQFEIAVAYFSSFMDLDLSQFDPDQPIPQTAHANGHTSFLDILKEQGARGRSLRDALTELHVGADDLGLRGSPEDVAERMAWAMDEVGGDGYLILSSDVSTEAYLDAATERLVPRLRELGCLRDPKPGATLRQNLTAF